MTDVVDSSSSLADGPSARGGESWSTDDSQVHALRRAVDARDRFIALIGHELRNTVAPMLLLAEQFTNLAEDPQAPPRMASRVAVLTRNLERLVATVDRVVEVADLRRGKLQLVPAATDLVEVVDDVCREMAREAMAAGAELAIDAAGPVIGSWDRARVKQIAANLISNAIRHGGGRVELIVRGDDHEGELVVRDHGPGLSAAVLPRLFDSFDDECAARRSGLGVGLWLVKTLCTAMGGSVAAENSDGGGARFRVVLPRG